LQSARGMIEWLFTQGRLNREGVIIFGKADLYPPGFSWQQP